MSSNSENVANELSKITKGKLFGTIDTLYTFTKKDVHYVIVNPIKYIKFLFLFIFFKKHFIKSLKNEHLNFMVYVNGKN